MIHHAKNFYPRSPCGERPETVKTSNADTIFLSTLSLRRATTDGLFFYIGRDRISIHALLAESDRLESFYATPRFYFYPRSPCGERQSSIEEVSKYVVISIHALLAESDPPMCFTRQMLLIISIHALLAESDVRLSGPLHGIYHFYPRSPCGERPWARGSRVTYIEISIHALLAESDQCRL